MKDRRIRIPSELAYLIAIVLLALSVAMLTSADFGISMIVAPAYLLSLKLDFLSFGQAEYVVQAILFLLVCLIIRRFRPIFLTSFLTCLLYGLALDAWRLIPFFNTAITPPETIDIWLRLLLFVLGFLLTAFSVSVFFKTYLYPQVYDFASKAISERYKLPLFPVKTAVDLSLLGLSFLLTFLFFGEIKAIGWGTIVIACLNSLIITLFGKANDRLFVFPPLFPKFEAFFLFSDGSKKEQ